MMFRCHKTCGVCEKIGHKVEMYKRTYCHYGIWLSRWIHKSCATGSLYDRRSENTVALKAELAAEKANSAKLATLLQAEHAKKKNLGDAVAATWVVRYGPSYKIESPNGTYVKVDTEADRIAALPKCGATKKCPACGGTSLKRTLIMTAIGVEDEYRYLSVCCLSCGNSGFKQERPLFNAGVKGKK